MTKNIGLTIFFLFFSIIILEWLNIDLWLQDYFYNFELNRWIVDRNEPVLKFIFYDGIKVVYILIILMVLISLLFFRKKKIVRDYKPGLFIVLFSCLSVPSLCLSAPSKPPPIPLAQETSFTMAAAILM